MPEAESSPLLTRLPAAPRKVLLLGETRLGAFICATPALRALRAALPCAELVMVTDESLSELVSRLRHLDRFVAEPSLEPARHAQDARHLTRFFLGMQAEDFDLGIQMHGYGLQSSPFFVLFGAQLNAGFVGRADMPGALDAGMPFPQQGHIVDRFLALSTFLGAPSRGRDTEFPLWPADEAEAERLLSCAPLPLLGVHPGARSEQRRWNPARFAEALASLQRRFGGTVVILGDQLDHPAAERIAHTVPGHCLNLAGQTRLPVLGAIIKRLSVFLTNDTGPAHIAYALSTPTVTLFASATPTPFWPPAREHFRALTCEDVDPGRYRGPWLDTIPVARVLEAAQEVAR